MFDREDRMWHSDCVDEELLRWADEPANADRPEAGFLRASDILSRYRRGSEAAEAVLLMEQAVKEEYAPAVFAMGQMFQWGWAVHKDAGKAMEFYRHAAELDYMPAVKALAEVRRRRLINIATTCIIALVCVLPVVGIFRLVRQTDPKTIIYVHRDTELTRTTNVEEYAGELRDLISAYDDELVISGQVSTNRLILRFESDRLDLSSFLADKVVAREDNVVIIQFSSEEEALRCLEELNRTNGIVFVKMDEYNMIQIDDLDDFPAEDIPLLAPKDMNADSYSWGVSDMGLDQLSDYVAGAYSDRSVLVAVMDTGAVAGSEFQDRFIPGYNVITGGDPLPDLHGTHTVGTILDCTRGTNVRVVNIDVFNTTLDGEVNGGGSRLRLSDSKYDLAITYAVNMGAQVINISMRTVLHNASFEDAVVRAVNAGVVVVKSAGNYSGNLDSGEISCPAELDEPIVVGAYDINHNIAGFSNYGSSVDVCAPGVDIYSQYYLDESSLIKLMGTSMATPHVAALAALVKMIYPNATPAQVELYIKDYCRNTNWAYDTGLFGAGAPDATCFIEMVYD